MIIKTAKNNSTYDLLVKWIDFHDKFCKKKVNQFKKYNDIIVTHYAKTSEIIATSFIKIFKQGPYVSFIGSPTISPIMAL